MFARNIDRHIGGRLDQRVEQVTDLLARAAAKLDQRRPAADQVGDFAGMCAQQGLFGARRIIFGKIADRVENLRAFLVVKEFARNTLLRLPETIDDRGQKIVVGVRIGDKIVQRAKVCCHNIAHQSSARRRPANCQRICG